MARGAASGVAAFVAGYVVVGVLVFVEVVIAAGRYGGRYGGGYGGGIGGDQLFNLVGWFFYSSHVSVEISGPLRSFNIISSLDWLLAIPTLVYYLVPVGLLFFAGLAAGRSLPRGVTPTAGAVAGAGVTAGYLPAVLLGTFLFSYSGASPELGTSLVVAGVVYPALFGGLGGFLASR